MPEDLHTIFPQADVTVLERHTMFRPMIWRYRCTEDGDTENEGGRWTRVLRLLVYMSFEFELKELQADSIMPARLGQRQSDCQK